ncbi:hypothetical protein EJV47_11680 [Hymenobacter gummosus]|uniref:Uncharacterized protein n=1 Tax=Hymenobacter gummosus TaxID=1776032 RepID=A0A431U3T1_9BACT|nr:hypothetical protein [Hymenobacter gummosus]RTQ50280.1 hypothetical protein EJV47_11680 [Hymenobacter gummosus]
MEPTAAFPPVFTEQQRFLRHWWGLLLLALIPALLPAIIAGVDGPRAVGAEAWVAPLVALALLGLVLSIRLDVRLDATGAHYRLWPLQLAERQQPWAEISRAYVRSYDPLGEYGGWGLKGTRRNRVLNVAGSEGIQLELLDGRRLLLGTQRPEEARRALAQLGHPAPETAAPL